MNKQERANKILQLLKTEFPDVTSPLDHTTAHELLFATILSAQCTDVRVNIVTKALFAKYITLEDYANADLDELKEIIRTTGFYNNKGKNIVLSARKILEDYNGIVPDTMQELVTLPGVARKTANVVLGQWFGKNEGFTVDTHVIRLSAWLGLSTNKNPVKLEKDLMKLFPKDEWRDTSLRLIFLGRSVLKARSPQYVGTIWEEFIRKAQTI